MCIILSYDTSELYIDSPTSRVYLFRQHESHLEFRFIEMNPDSQKRSCKTLIQSRPDNALNYLHSRSFLQLKSVS